MVENRDVSTQEVLFGKDRLYFTDLRLSELLLSKRDALCGTRVPRVLVSAMKF